MRWVRSNRSTGSVGTAEGPSDAFVGKDSYDV